MARYQFTFWESAQMHLLEERTEKVERGKMRSEMGKAALDQ
jgi:hypothetical protein